MHPSPNDKMMSETINQRLQQASTAWSCLFHNTTPIVQPQSPFMTTSTTQQPSQNNETKPEQHGTIPKIAIMQTNLTQNTPWGNKLQEKEDDILRIYAQNVNGIKLDADGGQYKEICDLVKEVKADILFCFQEHNLDTTQFKIRQILQNTTSKQWQRSR
jgi:hypothetical protein